MDRFFDYYLSVDLLNSMGTYVHQPFSASSGPFDIATGACSAAPKADSFRRSLGKSLDNQQAGKGFLLLTQHFVRPILLTRC